MSVPNIIRGTVTRTANLRGGTPSWLKAVYAIIIGMIALVTITTLFGTPAGEALKPCKSESQVSACYWDADTMGNGHGNDFVNK